MLASTDCLIKGISWILFGLLSIILVATGASTASILSYVFESILLTLGGVYIGVYISLKLQLRNRDIP